MYSSTSPRTPNGTMKSIQRRAPNKLSAIILYNMNTELYKNESPKQQVKSGCDVISQVQAFNDYTVFLVLEEERAKLKSRDEKCSVNAECNRLNLPLRYQHLDLSVEWFISRFERPVSEPEGSTQMWKQLDIDAYLVLRDLTRVLNKKKREKQLRDPANIFQALVSTVTLYSYLFIVAHLIPSCELC